MGLVHRADQGNLFRDSLDTLFLPRLISNQHLWNRRTCIGAINTFEVHPVGLRFHQCSGALGSVVASGRTQLCEVDAEIGLTSATFTQMNCFTSGRTAERSVGIDTGVPVVTNEQAADIARTLHHYPCGGSS